MALVVDAHVLGTGASFEVTRRMSKRKSPRKLALEIETVRALELARVAGGTQVDRPKKVFCPTTDSINSCKQF